MANLKSGFSQFPASDVMTPSLKHTSGSNRHTRWRFPWWIWIQCRQRRTLRSPLAGHLWTDTSDTRHTDMGVSNTIQVMSGEKLKRPLDYSITLWILTSTSDNILIQFKFTKTISWYNIRRPLYFNLYRSSLHKLLGQPGEFASQRNRRHPAK